MMEARTHCQPTDAASHRRWHRHPRGSRAARQRGPLLRVGTAPVAPELLGDGRSPRDGERPQRVGAPRGQPNHGASVRPDRFRSSSNPQGCASCVPFRQRERGGRDAGLGDRGERGGDLASVGRLEDRCQDEAPRGHRRDRRGQTPHQVDSQRLSWRRMVSLAKCAAGTGSCTGARRVGHVTPGSLRGRPGARSPSSSSLTAQKIAFAWVCRRRRSRGLTGRPSLRSQRT